MINPKSIFLIVFNLIGILLFLLKYWYKDILISREQENKTPNPTYSMIPCGAIAVNVFILKSNWFFFHIQKKSIILQYETLRY
jgi:hypothetical protein